MKKSKFIVSTLAAAVFAASSFGLAACGNGDQPDNGDGGNVIEVTFNANGGTFEGGAVTTKITADSDGKIAASALPTATRAETADNTYTFQAWYNAASGGSAVVWDNAFTESTTVYAHWTESAKNPSDNPDGGGTTVTGVFTITFDAGDGSVTPESATTSNGKLASLPAATPPTGLEFDGWYTGKSGTGMFVDTDHVFDSDSTVYAYYTDPNATPGEGEGAGYYIFGIDGSWTATPDYAFKAGSITLQLTAEDEIKIAYYDGYEIKWNDADRPTFGYDEIGAGKSYFTKVEDGEGYNNALVNADGKYTFTINGATIDVTKEGGGNEGGGDGDVTDVGTYKIGESGTAQQLTLKPLTSDEEKEGMTAQYWIDTVRFETGDKLYFAINGQPIELEIETSSSGVDTPTGTSNQYLEITNGGEFKIYLKLYSGKTYWRVYAGREVDPTEVESHTDTVEANQAYLVGNIQKSDATWSNASTNGFKLTERADGKYEIIKKMTAGDDFKFYKTGATLDSDRTWVGYIATENITDFISQNGSDSVNIKAKSDGNYYFLVDFARKEIYVSFSATGDPEEPEIPILETICWLRGIKDDETDWTKGWAMQSVAVTHDAAIEQYEIVVDIATSLTFKVVYDASNWVNAVHGNSPVTPSNSGGNLLLNAGKYKITFIVWGEGDWKIYIENVAE